MTEDMQILPNFKFVCQHVTIMLLLMDSGWGDVVKKGLYPKEEKRRKDGSPVARTF